jgi:prepilin-type N-terminal cleavage/methylation domain-containing protein
MRKGFTLIEILVAIALFSVITAIAAGGFTNALQTQRQISALIGAQSNVSLTLEQMAREIRTGYLFCHDINGAPQCTCRGGGSCGLVPPTQTEATVDLNFYNAAGSNVVYSLHNGALMKLDPSVGASAQPITGNNVVVKYLIFTLSGNTEGDHWTPRVTISLGVAPSSSDPGITNSVLDLQTSVSARGIDCDAKAVPVAC